MAGKKQINDVTLLANNEVVGYEPNTLKPMHGKGESQIRGAVIGGGQSEQIFSVDISTKFSSLKFSLPCTDSSVALVDGWKDNENNNVFELVGNNVVYNKIFTECAVTNEPEFDFSNEGSVEIEIKGNPAQ